MTRPMVVRFGGLGDMVLMTVAIRRLSTRFQSPVDVVGSGDWTQPLLQGQPGVGDIYLLTSRRRPFWMAPDQWRLVRNLRRRAVGPTWLFDARTERIRAVLSRAGWGSADLLTLDQLPDIPGEHFCDHWCRFVDLSPARAGIPAGDPRGLAVGTALPELTIPPELRPELTSWLHRLEIHSRRYILVQVGNKRTMRRGSRRRASNTKYWPEEYWAKVLRGLRDLHPGHALLLLGVEAEAAMNEEIIARASIGNARNLAREMSVPRLMALAERAFGMVSVDTGTAHVAAAMGCRLVTLFDSPSKRAMYAPRGPRALVSCIVGGSDVAPSLLGIAPDAVLTCWRDMRLLEAADSESA
jgi:ADP-heptose:LPS heptosyltransferase